MNNQLNTQKTEYINGFKRLYFYFYVFLTIYIEFGYATNVANVITGSVRMLILLIGTVPMLFMIRKMNLQTVLLISFLTIIVLFNISRDANIGNTILLFIPIFIGFVVSSAIDYKELGRIFSNLVFWLSVFSLVVFLLSVTYPSFISQFRSLGLRSESSAEVFDLFFSVGLVNMQIPRNYGLTWEPGAFAILLSIAIFFYMFIEPETKTYKKIILIFTMITTFSTMGYIVLGMLLLISLLQKKSDISFKKSTIFMMIFLSIVLIILPFSLTEGVFSKLSGFFSKNGDMAYTTMARVNAIKYPLLEFLKSPFFGVGYDRFSFVNQQFCNSVATNTVLNWFALMGVLLGVPCTFYYMKFIVKVGNKIKISIIGILMLCVTALFFVSTESLLRISLIYVLVFYGTHDENSIKLLDKDRKITTRKKHGFVSIAEEEVAEETAQESDETTDSTETEEAVKSTQSSIANDLKNSINDTHSADDGGHES